MPKQFKDLNTGSTLILFLGNRKCHHDRIREHRTYIINRALFAENLAKLFHDIVLSIPFVWPRGLQ